MQEEIKAGLSVIIPNYNHANHLPQALEAILAQAWKPVEIIVVDDASTDESCRVIKSYQLQYPSIQLVQLQENSGPAIAMNRGLQLACGKYVALCASDDIVQPGFFEDSMQFLTLHPEAAICCGDFYTFRDDQERSIEHLLPLHKSKMFLPDEFVQAVSCTKFYIPSQVSIYKKEYLLKYGGYLPELKSLCDFFLNLQIALRHPVGYIPKIFGAYRIAPHSYARALRFKLYERNRMCAILMQAIRREEKSFQEKVQKSGILAHAGIYMIAYLAYHPQYWRYLPASFKKRFFRKYSHECGGNSFDKQNNTFGAN